MKLTLHSLTAKPSTITVSDAIFGAEVNLALIAQAVHVYRSNQRQGGAKALTRGEVNRTGAKWFKQKGTGNARHGARTAPQFVGGGVAHGPTGAENWKRTLPKKMAQKALITTLSAQAQEKNVSVMADLANISGKTKDAQNWITSLELTGSALIVVDTASENILRAFGNIDNVSITRADRLNAYEVASADSIIVAQPALEVLETRLAAVTSSKKAVKAAPVVAEEVAPVAKKKAAPKKTTAKKAA